MFMTNELEIYKYHLFEIMPKFTLYLKKPCLQQERPRLMTIQTLKEPRHCKKCM